MQVILSFLAVCGTFAFGAAGYYYFSHNKRRKRIDVLWAYGDVVRTPPSAAAQISVTYNDIRVENPFIITIALFNSGIKDVATADFDDGANLSIDMGAEVIAQLEMPETGSSRLMIDPTSPTRIILEPCKMARSSEQKIRLLVQGEPAPTLDDHPLIDTDVEVMDYSRYNNVVPKLMRVFRRAVLVATVIIAILTLVTSKKFGGKIFHASYKDTAFGNLPTSPTWLLVIAIIEIGVLFVVGVLFLSTLGWTIWGQRRHARTRRLFE